ncbi:hypothetical protein L7F22_062091 [Adiantum nelumboides]|nr:hypothetical protein [Adiantum nelumboides]
MLLMIGLATAWTFEGAAAGRSVAQLFADIVENGDNVVGAELAVEVAEELLREEGKLEAPAFVQDIDDPDPAAAAGVLHAFSEWMAKHNKVWRSTEEMAQRLEAFAHNLRYIKDRNKQLQEEGASYQLGLNSFAHLSFEEFRQAFLQDGGYVDHAGRRNVGGSYIELPGSKGRSHFLYENATDIPPSVDWRERGAVVSAVKDQGQCGNCWAFATVATVESAHQIATGELVSLSEQELVDCDRAYNQGCNGGLPDYAYTFIINNGGLDAESHYRYTARRGRCNRRKMKVHAASIADYQDVPASDERALLKAVAHQPVSVAIDASSRDFQLYQGGVFSASCGKSLNHAVVVVGYGYTTIDDGSQEVDEEFWVVRNSWGSGWGEAGYVRMQRGSNDPDGLCGINMEPSFPIVHTTSALISIE